MLSGKFGFRFVKFRTQRAEKLGPKSGKVQITCKAGPCIKIRIFFYSTYPGVGFAELTFVEYRACIRFANCKLGFVFSVLALVLQIASLNLFSPC